jgi:hypothetical protein
MSDETSINSDLTDEIENPIEHLDADEIDHVDLDEISGGPVPPTPRGL